ncbi:hypothetical protein G6L37_05755 [Agrobacterium rubi]|nr:hypothetical protein [Agrobacterium rubi]NTF24864.1 hypothetical protein [Agrobacterium rubi]
MASRNSFNPEDIVAAARAQDWQAVYSHCTRVLDDADQPDAIFTDCCEKLPNDIADVFLQVARDAAGDMVTDDSEDTEGVLKVIETSYTLFAIPVMVLPHAKPTADDFDILAACLRAAADGDDIHIVPEVVATEDFLAATPDALRYAIGVIDWNRLKGHDLDPLEHIVDRSVAERPAPRLSSVIVGARVETFVGGTDFIPANWVSDATEGRQERFRDLLKIHDSVFASAEWPMSAGRILPTLTTRLGLEEVINEIASIGNELEILPDVLVYEDLATERTFIALSVEGHPLSDTVIDRRGSTMDSGDMAGMLRTFVPDVAETDDPKLFTRAIMTRSVIN